LNIDLYQDHNGVQSAERIPIRQVRFYSHRLDAGPSCIRR